MFPYIAGEGTRLFDGVPKSYATRPGLQHRLQQRDRRAAVPPAPLTQRHHMGRLVAMVEPAYSVKALDESTWDAFAALVERNNGVFGGCWCMGFHPEGVGKQTTAALNRKRKLGRVRAGEAHAALVFNEDDCVGWCQFGVPELNCRGSRVARRTRRVRRHRRTGGSRAATSAKGTGVRASPPPGSPVRSTSSRTWEGGPLRDTRRTQGDPPASFSTVHCRRMNSSGSSESGRSANTAGSSPGCRPDCLAKGAAP